MFNVFTRLCSVVRNRRTIVRDGLSFFAGVWHHHTALAAENLFLRKQLALFREREKKAMPTTPADRFVFSKLARWFDWRSALMIVKPATLICWHRNVFRLFWRWKSRPVGRPRVTVEIRDLIRRLAAENPTWGEQRIADDLLLKLQIRLSPRTVAKYSKQLPGPHGSRDQRWSTFLKNHANAIVACDFFRRCDGLLSRGLCVRGAGDRFATADSFQCNGTSDGGVDFATAAGSVARRSGIQVSASRPPQDLLCWFGRGSRELGYRSIEITGTCANRECFLRTIHRNDPSRVFGLCDTAERISSEAHASRMAEPLQYWPSSSVIGARHSRSG
jgi:hypothetical protein